MNRGPSPVAITVSQAQRHLLEDIVRARHSAQGRVTRARIVLGAAEGRSNLSMARQEGLSRSTVILWRRRWAQAAPTLDEVEAQGDPAKLREAVCTLLDDAPRPGCPSTFTPEQVCAVVALACEKVKDSERPVDSWSHRELADEACRRGIVSSISARSVGRFLKSGGSATPHRAVLAQQRAR